MAISFSDKRILTGARTVLVPVTEGGADELAPLLRDLEVSVLTGSVSSSTPTDAELQPYSLAELREIYARWAIAGDRIVWTIRDRREDRIFGEAVLNDLDVRNLSCGFRI